MFFVFYFTGSFGNGVLSYFTFLKWLLWLNIYIFVLTLCFVIVPQALSSGEELPLTLPPQNASSFTSNSSSSFTVVPTNATASSPARKKRDVLLKNSGEDDDLKCNLVKPYNYSSYTNKPFPQLLSDFISGIVSMGLLIMVSGEREVWVRDLRPVSRKPGNFNGPTAMFQNQNLKDRKAGSGTQISPFCFFS